MRNFFAAVMLAFALIVVGSVGNQAEAAKAWDAVCVGYYSDGTPAMLFPESIYGNRNNFSCDVRAGSRILHYNFWYAGGGPYYRNSYPAEGYVYGGGSPAAAAIWEWVQRHR